MSDSTLGFVLTFVMGFLIALFLGSVIWHHTPAINCPTEDSCHAEYFNGQWWILRDTP